ncbi:MAG TPA: DUF4417 domain-containing protein, partial [Methanotrichaceae archaeon]|nr:DUF4417 domain-containing protein [Methanotrichaceae archaeon]
NRDIDALATVIGDLGFKNVVYINKDATEVGAGVGRITAAARLGLEELPVFRILDLDKVKFKKFRISDNRLNELSNKWDEEILFQDLSELTKNDEDWKWMDFDKFDRLLSQKDLVQEVALDEPLSFDGPESFTPSQPSQELGSQTPDLRKRDTTGTVLPEQSVPMAENEENLEIVFPSANEWGIPDLSLKYQATQMTLPFVKWGELSYKKPHGGIWNFYVYDSKFESIASEPHKPLMAKPSALVEINYSTFIESPAALVLGDIFFKRWTSRYWQSKGANIIVDLYVVNRFTKMNLIGVPKGWKSYCTRGVTPHESTDGLEIIKRDWEIACQHSEAAEEDIFFVVYAGGKAVQEYCADKGWHWIPERMQAISDPNLAGMDGLPAKVSSDKYKDLK